jgi:hypothetical protein
MGVRKSHTWWASTALLWLLLASCVTARIYEPENVPLQYDYSISLAQVSDRVERAARMQGWKTERLSSGHLVATKRKGRHVGTVTIVYDTAKFSLLFRNAVDFKQSGGRIHKLYNEWIRNLEDTIQMEFASPH